MINDDLILEVYPQEDICEYCERYIIERKHSTINFLCEGRWCSEAMDGFIDNLTDDDLNKISCYVRKQKIEKLKNIINGKEY